jgi:hypothetical protein
MKGWKADGTVRRFSPSDLTLHIDGGAEIVLEFGFVGLEAAHYRNAGAGLSLDLYRMESPEASIGLYLASGGSPPGPAVGPDGAEPPGTGWVMRSPTQWLARRGPYFLKLENPDGDTLLAPVQEALLRKTFTGVPPDGAIPLLEELGRPEWTAGSVRLFRGAIGLEQAYTFGSGDVFGLAGGFGVFGVWRDPDGAVVTRFRIDYPDESRAAAALDSLAGRLDLSIRRIGPCDGGFVFRDYADEFGDARVDGASLVVRVHLKADPGRSRPRNREEP